MAAITNNGLYLYLYGSVGLSSEVSSAATGGMTATYTVPSSLNTGITSTTGLNINGISDVGTSTASTTGNSLTLTGGESSSSGLSGMGMVSAFSSVASAISSIASAYYAGKVAKIQTEMTIRQAEFNQRQAQRGAEMSLRQSAVRIGQISEKYEQTKASQRAAMAANGVVLGVGSAAEVTTSTDINKRRDINTEYANGYWQAANYYAQAAGYSIQASNAAASGTAASAASFASGIGNAASSLVSGYKDYLMYNYMQNGGGTGVAGSLLLNS